MEYGTTGTSVFTLHIANAHTVKRLLLQGALGFGEAYMEGNITITGDIEAYLALRHQFRHVRPSFRLVYAKLLAQLTQPWGRKKQIAYHYDLGTEFFSLLLDATTMSYSAGRFVQSADTLDQAQVAKLQLVGDWLQLPPGATLLDLGAGWGGFAEYSATKLQLLVDGYSLSKKQLDYATTRIKKVGKSNTVSLVYQDFITATPSRKYEGMVMIEALEHVGQNNLVSFMTEVSEALAPGAPWYLQFTGRYRPKLVDPWTLKYVFPGGHLPAKEEFLAAVTAAGLMVERFEDNTDDYLKTMRLWIDALESNQTEIEALFSPSFFRRWQLWMHGAYVNFDLGDMSLFRVLLRKP